MSDQVFEISIEVLNPYTYLRDGDNWIVAFNTIGTADLTINSTNAGWAEFLTDNLNTFDEMRFLDIRCGNVSLKDSLQLIDGSGNHYNYSQVTEQDSIEVRHLLIENYSCNETGYLSNNMPKAGYAILQFTFGGQTAYAHDPAWWNNSFQYRMNISVNSSDVDSALTDFPVMVYLNSSRIDWSHVQNDLDDLRFIDEDSSTILPYEIENYTVNDEAWLWVKVNASSSSDTNITLYYGNTTVGSGEDVENVWDDNFMMVQHMDGSTYTDIDDSTSNNNDVTIQRNSSTYNSEGQIDSAVHFDRSNGDSLGIPDSDTLDHFDD